MDNLPENTQTCNINELFKNNDTFVACVFQALHMHAKYGQYKQVRCDGVMLKSNVKMRDYTGCCDLFRGFKRTRKNSTLVDRLKRFFLRKLLLDDLGFLVLTPLTAAFYKNS